MNPKPAKYAWCFVLGKEKDYDAYIYRCEFCLRSVHKHCLLEWGFLTDHTTDLRETPTIRLVNYYAHVGNFNVHYNVITIDSDFAWADGEEILSHEYMHVAQVVSKNQRLRTVLQRSRSSRKNRRAMLDSSRKQMRAMCCCWRIYLIEALQVYLSLTKVVLIRSQFQIDSLLQQYFWQHSCRTFLSQRF